MQITDVMIDAGARELRERQVAGKIHRNWADIPNSSKKTWREYARAVLEAAATAKGDT